MSIVPIIRDEDASPEAKVLFMHSKKLYGRVANAVRVAANSPKLAQVLFGFIVASQRNEISGLLSTRIKAMVNSQFWLSLQQKEAKLFLKYQLLENWV